MAIKLNSDQIKHLELIQAVISRMASNSFLVKGWTVTLLAGIFLVGNGEDHCRAYGLSAAVISVFWWLDAFLLAQERSFRGLYDFMRQQKLAAWMKDPFSMKAPDITLRLVFFSQTLLGFYGTLLLLVAAGLFRRN